MQIILYAFPTMILVIAGYLYLYKDTLAKLLKLEKFYGIDIFIGCYLLLAILGFFIMANASILFIFGWIFVVILLTSILSFILYKSIK